MGEEDTSPCDLVTRRYPAICILKPYYTFNTKGKDETLAYRVPIARLLQEQQEESRLLPGLARTNEAVFNVPRHGKNYEPGLPEPAHHPAQRRPHVRVPFLREKGVPGGNHLHHHGRAPSGLPGKAEK
jgi:L-lysine 2,3-aminomutase